VELDELTAELVWLEVTATRAAKSFCTFCERIAAAREGGLEKIEGPSEIDEPRCGGRRQGKRGRGADGSEAYNKLSLNGFHHRGVNHDKTLVGGKLPINGLESFRGYAKRRLKAYHRGFKRNSLTFIHERSFRFIQPDDENGDDDNALNYLRTGVGEPGLRWGRRCSRPSVELWR
jgi:transposase-like protein